MHFSTGAIATALMGLASAQTTHVVSVSSANNTLKFFPDNLKPAIGDQIQFQFLAGNHSVVQSNFDNPCEPIQLHAPATKGVFSGYMNVAAGAATGQIPVWTMPVTNSTPVWIYCSQGMHCQKGMVLVLNENTAANSSRSLANFKTLAASAAANLDPFSAGLISGDSGSGSGSSGSSGGSSSEIPTPTGSGSSTGGSGTSTGTPSGSTPPGTSPSGSSIPQALGSTVSVSAWSGLLTIAALAAML
ncbi:hypothetical protein F4777DRAFT_590026 [Nemania sp. FL0916]|nr:hypothetical protein F4777DRAFT_590026 [Nemania sp. FL0916]